MRGWRGPHGICVRNPRREAETTHLTCHRLGGGRRNGLAGQKVRRSRKDIARIFTSSARSLLETAGTPGRSCPARPQLAPLSRGRKDAGPARPGPARPHAPPRPRASRRRKCSGVHFRVLSGRRRRRASRVSRPPPGSWSQERRHRHGGHQSFN